MKRTLDDLIEERESVIERVFALQKRLRELKREIATTKTQDEAAAQGGTR